MTPPELNPVRRPEPPARVRRLMQGAILNPRHARVVMPRTETQIATADQRARGGKV